MEILLKNGWIIDGTGSSRYKSDIAIKDNKILKIGSNLEGDGYDIIYVSNKIIAPGFIDMHSHADLTILEVNKAEAAIMQGITTLVVGMCGIVRAPANEKVRKYYSNFISKAFGSSVS
ncbi:N-acyl-D-glutamate deacylase [subsurface metagenome]